MAFAALTAQSANHTDATPEDTTTTNTSKDFVSTPTQSTALTTLKHQPTSTYERATCLDIEPPNNHHGNLNENATNNPKQEQNHIPT